MQKRFDQMDGVALSKFIKLTLFMTTSESGLSSAEREAARTRLEAAYEERKRRNPAEKRKHTRHEFIGEITVVRDDGSTMRAASYGISVGGMSAATVSQLAVGEQVFITPVLGEQAAAIVRSRCGPVYGFEFVSPTADFQYGVLVLCETLPVSKTAPNI